MTRRGEKGNRQKGGRLIRIAGLCLTRDKRLKEGSSIKAQIMGRERRGLERCGAETPNVRKVESLEDRENPQMFPT